ncbi:MAG: hypothetical protein AB8G17_14890 [Gammaproteobacteria bacterium]
MSSPIVKALRYPLQGSVALAIIAYVLLDAFAQFGGLFGLALRWFVNVGAFAYSYIIFRSAANGRDKVPAMSAEETNFFGSSQVLSALLLVLLASVAATYANAFLSPTAALMAQAGLTVILPASLSLMILNQSLADALNPVKVIQTMALLGAPYLLMPATALVAGIAFALIKTAGLPSLLNDLIGAYLYVAVISAWGILLHHFRDRIGLEQTNETSVRDAMIERQVDHDRKAQMDVAFAESRTDHKRALAAVEELFKGDNDTLEQREWAFEYARDWPGEMVPLRLAQQLINRHLMLGNETRALELSVYGLSRAAKFRPAGANATLKVASIARNSARPRVVTALLSDFGTRFADHAQAGAAALMCAVYATEKTNELDLARAQLKIIGKTALASDPRVARLRASLDAT